jgi:AcrR family transcriptional regulator
MSPKVIVCAATPGVLAPATVPRTNDPKTKELATAADRTNLVRVMDPPSWLLAPSSDLRQGQRTCLLIDKQDTFSQVNGALQRRSQAERRSQSEEALLTAAAQMVSERGVQGATLANIGGRAGVSRGLPTHHFGSKDALVAQLAERAQNKIEHTMVETLRQHAEVHGNLPVLEQILVEVDAYLELFVNPEPDVRALLVMWGSTFPSNASVDGLGEAERRSYVGLSGQITSGQEEGSIRSDVDPMTSAVLLHGLMRGVAALFLSDAGLAEMDGVRRTCHEWVASALAPR